MKALLRGSQRRVRIVCRLMAVVVAAYIFTIGLVPCHCSLSARRWSPPVVAISSGGAHCIGSL
jgi:hypothetical protein